MPQMKMHRNHRLASTSGHVIQFRKGEPVAVPESLVKEALSVGAVMIDEAELERLMPEEVVLKAAPVGTERDMAILAAFKAISDRNERDDFTAAGMPTQAAVAGVTGFKPDKKELPRLWAQYLEALALAKEAA